MQSTSAVEVSIQATSPLFGVGAGGLASSFFSSALAAGASAAGLSCACAIRGTAFKPIMHSSASHAASFLKSIFISFSPCVLERFRAGLAGADAYYLLQLEDENLAVPDLAGVRRFLDGLDHLLEQLGLD